MIIDAHAHYLLPAWADILWSSSFRASTQWPRMVLRSHLLGDPHILLAAAQMRGIDHTICMPEISAPPGPHINGGRDAMMQIVREMNDATANIANQSPQHITGIAVAVPDSSPEMLAEIHRAILLLGLKGIVIASSTPGIRLEDTELDPFYATIVRYQIPLIIHPSILVQNSAGRDFGIDLLHQYPAALAGVIVKCIVSGRFKRHPNLNIIIPYGGGGLLHLIGWIQSTGDLSIDILTELRKLYFDTAGLTSSEIEFILSVAGGEHILFGTDWPMIAANAPSTLHSESMVNAATGITRERERILFGNAQRLFGIH